MKVSIGAEINLLYRCEAAFKLPAAPIINQLVAENERPLPKRLPRMPKPAIFDWPDNEIIDLQSYWRGKRWNPWNKPL